MCKHDVPRTFDGEGSRKAMALELARIGMDPILIKDEVGLSMKALAKYLAEIGIFNPGAEEHVR